MQAVQLLKESRGAERAAGSGNETLLASSTTSGSAGAPTERPFFSLAEVYTADFLTAFDMARRRSLSSTCRSAAVH